MSVGRLEECPGCRAQGLATEELRQHLKEICNELASGRPKADLPGAQDR